MAKPSALPSAGTRRERQCRLHRRPVGGEFEGGPISTAMAKSVDDGSWFKVIWGKLKWLHLMPYDLIPLDIMYALTWQKWNPHTDQQTSSDSGSALLQAITDEAKPSLCSRSFSPPNHWLSTSIFTSILVYPWEYIYLIHINRLGRQHRRLKINPSLWSSSSAIRGPMKWSQGFPFLCSFGWVIPELDHHSYLVWTPMVAQTWFV